MHETACELSCQMLKLHVDLLFDFISSTMGSNHVLLISVRPELTRVS